MCSCWGCRTGNGHGAKPPEPTITPATDEEIAESERRQTETEVPNIWILALILRIRQEQVRGEAAEAEAARLREELAKRDPNWLKRQAITE